MGAAPRIRANQRHLDLDLAKYLSQLNTTPDESTLGKLQDALEALLSERSHPMIIALTSQREHINRVRDLIGHELELRQTRKRAIKVEGDEASPKRRRRNLNQEPDQLIEISNALSNSEASITDGATQSPGEFRINVGSAASTSEKTAPTENHESGTNPGGLLLPNDVIVNEPASNNPELIDSADTDSAATNNEFSKSTGSQVDSNNIKDEITNASSTSANVSTETQPRAQRSTVKSDRKNVSDKALSQNEVIPNNTKYVTNPKSEFVSTQSLPAHTFYVFHEGDEKNEDEEAYKRRLGVVSYPKEDLSTLTAGPVPMDDYTRAKPSNQVQFNTYAAFLEPYFRQFTEEDLQFLQQPRPGNASEAINLKTGKKLSPYVIPPLGPHYLHNWAIQDAELIGAEVNSAARKTNETHISDLIKLYDAAGSINDITDQSLEASSYSLGPLTERLIAALVPESTDNKEITGLSNSPTPSTVVKAEPPATVPPETTGNSSSSSIIASTISKDVTHASSVDNSITTATSTANLSRASSALEVSANDQFASNDTSTDVSRTTSVAPDYAFSTEEPSSLQIIGSLAAPLKELQQPLALTDFGELEDQIRSEYQRVGVLDSNWLQDFDQFKTDFRLAVTNPRDELADLDQPAIDWVNGAEDDEICRELRFLQSKLRQVSARNTVYRERLQPVIQEQLSWQEYQSILQDLDKQVDQAYQKRQKMPSSKQKKKKSVDSPHDSNAGTPLGGGPYTPDYTKYSVDIRPTIKALIDKRERWIGRIGPLFRPAHEMMREYEIPKFSDLESQVLANQPTNDENTV